MAHIVILHNPFLCERGRELIIVDHPITIATWLTQTNAVTFELPTICLINGHALLRQDWQTTMIQANDVVTFITLPQGSGGGGKILRSVLMIAVMVAAPAIGGAVAAGLGITSSIGVGLVTAGVALAGTALVNVLVPPPMASIHGFDNTPAPSPTYSLQARGNQARLSQPIPVIYGRHIVYPDLASTPYSHYANNEQYLYQLHCIGQGDYEIESIRIEDTPISSFKEITYEVVPPGNHVTLFSANVITAPEIAGQELLSTSDGGGYVGGFVVNPADTIATQLSIDIIMPRGLYYANDGGGLDARTITWVVDARQIDDEGNPLQDWQRLGSETMTAATNTPQRLTYHYAVLSGRYEVRALRTNNKDTSARSGNELRWAGLKATLNQNADMGNITLLAIKMRATDNLSQRASRLVNCIVTRKLPTWNRETGWSAPKATRSIAWSLADIVKNEYGGNLPDSRIDLQALANLDAIWQQRNDTVDVVFDQPITAWEALTRVARCGRAVCFMQTGIVRFVRDEPREIPVALFSPRNIVKHSLKLHYLLASDDTADSVIVEYFCNQTWRPDEVQVSLPNSTSEQPARVRLLGCTDKQQAIREGKYMAATNHYRRRLVTFQTELEGLIPTYGDLIAITHDMPSWGQGAEVVSVEGNTLTLSEPLTWDENKLDEHVIGLRKQDGSVSGTYQVLPGNNANQVIIQGDFDFQPYTGESQERTHVAFGVGNEWSTLARVTAVRPRGDVIEISAVTEHPAVHTADA